MEDSAVWAAAAAWVVMFPEGWGPESRGKPRGVLWPAKPEGLLVKQAGQPPGDVPVQRPPGLERRGSRSSRDSSEDIHRGCAHRGQPGMEPEGDQVLQGGRCRTRGVACAALLS